METIVLKNLVRSLEYATKVIPFIQEDYFQDRAQRIVYECIKAHHGAYGTVPSKDALLVALADKAQEGRINESHHDDLEQLTDAMYESDVADEHEWLVVETEKFCKKQALVNAAMESMGIIDGSDQERNWEAIPDIFSKALQVGFSTEVGHDYLGDYQTRYDDARNPRKRVPFDLQRLNDITDNGCEGGSLNLVFAPPGGGKSAFLCHHAAFCLSSNLNAVYISMEMSERKIANRIDANLLGVTTKELKTMTRDTYVERMAALAQTARGRLFIKRFPTTGASAVHFRALLEELRAKRSLVPDILFVDYLNICASSRFKPGNKGGSYEYIKAIAEEIRALGVLYDIPVWSACQFNRTGAESSDPSLANAADSYGIAYTADLAISLYRNDAMIRDNQVYVKQLKNRDNDRCDPETFMLGMDLRKMRFFDVDDITNMPTGTALDPGATSSSRGGAMAETSQKVVGWNLE